MWLSQAWTQRPSSSSYGIPIIHQHFREAKAFGIQFEVENTYCFTLQNTMQRYDNNLNLSWYFYKWGNLAFQILGRRAHRFGYTEGFHVCTASLSSKCFTLPLGVLFIFINHISFQVQILSKTTRSLQKIDNLIMNVGRRYSRNSSSLLHCCIQMLYPLSNSEREYLMLRLVHMFFIILGPRLGWIVSWFTLLVYELKKTIFWLSLFTIFELIAGWGRGSDSSINQSH